MKLLWAGGRGPRTGYEGRGKGPDNPNTLSYKYWFYEVIFKYYVNSIFSTNKYKSLTLN